MYNTLRAFWVLLYQNHNTDHEWMVNKGLFAALKNFQTKSPGQTYPH